jgi:hypothetical protein
LAWRTTIPAPSIGTTELDDAADLGVEVVEGRAAPGHMVGGAGVQVPQRLVVFILAGVELGEDLGFNDLEAAEAAGGARRG